MFDIKITLYLGFSSVFWALIISNYSFRKNIYLYEVLSSIYLGNGITYVLMNKILFDNKLTNHLLVISIGFISIFLIITQAFKSQIRICNDFLDMELFPKRRRDIKRLKEYINEFNIIGLNAKWGDGKSFIVSKLKNEVKENYEIIDIDLLSCNYNEFEVTLIDKIEKVMYKNKILSKYSNKLKNLVSNQSYMYIFRWLISGNNYSYSKVVEEFKNEIIKIDSKVLIIYEDIDRISDVDLIKRIFAISERLSCDNLKIIYQYDEKMLIRKGLDFNYLEKYIQYKMNLTELSFLNIISLVLKEDKKILKKLDLEDFDFLVTLLTKNKGFLIDENFDFEIDIYFKDINYSIRKIRNFLKEIHNILNEKEYNNYKRVVISFFFIKHFLPQIYNKLSIKKTIIETFKFKVDSDSYKHDILVLIDDFNKEKIDSEKVKTIFCSPDNRLHYLIIRLYSFNYYFMKNELEYTNLKEKNKEISEEPIELLTNKNSNKKKNRIIWSLLANGKSKYTNYEFVTNKFIEEVLSKEGHEQKSAYLKFNNDLFDSKYSTDNGTIFRLGFSSFIELFKGFRVTETTPENRMKLIEFFIKEKEISVIDEEFIRAINYLNLETREELLFLLTCINKLNIETNLNINDSYSLFLKNILDQLCKKGYFDGSNISLLYDEIRIYRIKGQVLGILKDKIKELEELKKDISAKIEIKKLMNDFDIIIVFIQKMIQLINFPSTVESNNDKIDKISINATKSQLPNQQKYDELKKIEKNKKLFFDSLISSYENGKITAYEIKQLINEVF